jgi:hypothetical protein
VEAATTSGSSVSALMRALRVKLADLTAGVPAENAL